MTIQVYEFDADQVPSDWPREFVSHADHLAAVDRAKAEAKIAVLEEIWAGVASDIAVLNKIAALRKELE